MIYVLVTGPRPSRAVTHPRKISGIFFFVSGDDLIGGEPVEGGAGASVGKLHGAGSRCGESPPVRDRGGVFLQMVHVQTSIIVYDYFTVFAFHILVYRLCFGRVVCRSVCG